MIRLVATDLDGTLLRNDKTVSPWTRSVIEAAQNRGIHVVPVTARQPVAITAIAEQAGLAGWAIAVNGGYGYHLTTGEVAFCHPIESDVMNGLVAALRDRLPEVRFAAVPLPGERFRVEAGYRDLALDTDHQPAISTCVELSADELCGSPALKLICRHPELSPAELAVLVDELPDSGVHATHSGAGFLEMAPAEVTKATGMADLCAHLGIEQSESASFGDAHNDLEMLRWAGVSWAMPEADQIVKDAATHIARSNEDDGVGRALMEILREQDV